MRDPLQLFIADLSPSRFQSAILIFVAESQHKEEPT